jgi:hypothetical protein
METFLGVCLGLFILGGAVFLLAMAFTIIFDR